jgi:flagellar assembly protein FliH
MRNSYSMVETFTLSNFIDEREQVQADPCAEFISFFDRATFTESGTVRPAPKAKAMDPETEARKVFEDAYIQGEKAGQEMGMKKVEPLLKRLTADIAALSAFKEDLAKKAEKLAVELAIMFAESIVLKECEEKKDVVVAMAKNALQICNEKNGITIRMRRDDARHITEEAIHPLRVIPDDSLKDPGFIIETDFGDIDGTLSTQIEELKREFVHGYTDR